MERRLGWATLAVVCGVMGGLTVIGAVVAAIAAASRRDLGDIALALGGGLLVGAFWRWMGLGCWYRSDGRVEASPVGPWGVVGRVLMVVLVGGGVALVVWAEVATRRDEDRAERLAEQAETEARRRQLTVDQVAQAVADRTVAVWEGKDDPIAALLAIPDGVVAAAEVEDGVAYLLVDPNGASGHCAIVTIDAADLVDTTISTSCTIATRPR